MNDLYVGFVKNPADGSILAVAVGYTMNTTMDLTEKWVKEKGDPSVQYKIGLYEVEEKYIDVGEKV